MLPSLGARANLPVRLPALAGWSGLEVWRSSAELGRGNSQSWAKESSAEGFHQLHGSIVLEEGRRQGHVTTAARRDRASEGGLPTQPPARTLPSPHLASLSSTLPSWCSCQSHRPRPSWNYSGTLPLGGHSSSVQGPLSCSNQLPRGF